MKILKYIGLGLLALFLIGIVISVATPEGRQGMDRALDDIAATPSPTPTEAAVVATPEPTVEATPEPTAEPTAQPTPRPTTVALTGDASAFTTFAERVLTYSPVFLRELDAVMAASERGNLSDIFDTALTLWSSLGTERIEVGAMDVRPCFETAHGKYLDALNAYWKSMDLFTDAVIYDDVSMVEEGIDWMERGTRHLNESSAALDSVSCAP